MHTIFRRSLMLVAVSIGLVLPSLAQSSTPPDSVDRDAAEDASPVDARLFHGRWHMTEVVLELDESIGYDAEAAASIEKSKATQRKVKRQIQAGELAIITQFNYDGTYTHELVYADPDTRFPAYRETGTWSWEATAQAMSRQVDGDGPTSLPHALVKRITDTELVLEVAFTEGNSKGIVETVYLRRFAELKQNR
ncbi:MAG: hypothetical protein AAF399_13990 [Bacteroidota bacterium]